MGHRRWVNLTAKGSRDGGSNSRISTAVTITGVATVPKRIIARNIRSVIGLRNVHRHMARRVVGTVVVQRPIGMDPLKTMGGHSLEKSVGRWSRRVVITKAKPLGLRTLRHQANRRRSDDSHEEQLPHNAIPHCMCIRAAGIPHPRPLARHCKCTRFGPRLRNDYPCSPRILRVKRHASRRIGRSCALVLVARRQAPHPSELL